MGHLLSGFGCYQSFGDLLIESAGAIKNASTCDSGHLPYNNNAAEVVDAADDGNLGITAGICEMLLQSHAGEIAILPSLPKAWSQGSFSGLCARGGVSVDASWKDGKLINVILHPSVDSTQIIVMPDRSKKTVLLKKGKVLEIKA